MAWFMSAQARRCSSWTVVAWLLGTAVVLGSGCGAIRPPPLEGPRSDDASLVYGYLDMEEGPSPVSWVEILPAGPSLDAGVRVPVRDGLFYRENMPPGAYLVRQMGGNSAQRFVELPHIGVRNRVILRHELAPQHTPVRVHVQEPGAYFIGSFRYEPVHNNAPASAGRTMFELDKAGTIDTAGEREAHRFILRTAKRPTALEIVDTLLPLAEQTAWKPVLLKQRAELRAKGGGGGAAHAQPRASPPKGHESARPPNLPRSGPATESETPATAGPPPPVSVPPPPPPVEHSPP